MASRLLPLLLLNLLQLLALYQILIGLIGTKNVSNRVTPVPQLLHGSPLNYTPSASRIAIIIIDALRVDFLTNYRLPHLERLLQEPAPWGCAFVCNTRPPTVTLPRIKAIVTGSISSYWDVIQNFNSGALRVDNFITRARAAEEEQQQPRRTLVFYGDDTWLKLFPSGSGGAGSFDRSEGVTSFYVNDWTEVDWNVTRNLDLELAPSPKAPQGAWDLLLLHYLGLDHIGHVHGLRRPDLIQGKLLEIDAVIERVWRHLQEVLERPGGLPSYLIVTGDHGMANIGGHGANSKPEVTTPFILLSTRPSALRDAHSRTKEAPWPEMEQVDIATTLALLWGLPIPNESLGKLVQGVIADPQKEMTALYYNAVHLRNLGAFEGDEIFQELVASHVKLLQSENSSSFLSKAAASDLIEGYHRYLEELSARATRATIGEQNVIQIVGGLGLLLVSLVALLWSQHTELSALGASSSLELVVLHTLAPFLLYFASSFVEEEHYLRHYLWATCLALHLASRPSKSDPLPFQWRRTLAILTCLAAHRLASAWNSTGQKWTHLESISDAVPAEWMQLLVFGVALPVITFLQTRGRLSFGGTLLLVILVKFWGRNVTLERVAFGMIALQAIYGRRVLQTWILLTVLLFKFGNVPLLAMELLQVQLLLQDAVDGDVGDSEGSSKALLSIWFGWTAFYYQGNSNNIASVDINSGYIGQTAYNPTIAGLLIFCNIYSAPILSTLAFLTSSSSPEPPTRFLHILTLLTGYNSFIYTLALLLFRQHLFIWSVFTPKLLYILGFAALNTALGVGAFIWSSFAPRNWC